MLVDRWYLKQNKKNSSIAFVLASCCRSPEFIMVETIRATRALAMVGERDCEVLVGAGVTEHYG